jgi:UDP-glucose 4-epimerase
VGTGRPSSVREVIATVERVTGRTLWKRVVPRRPGDPAVLCASAQRIREELGWVPARPALETIVADAWRWHSSHPGGFAGEAR